MKTLIVVLLLFSGCAGPKGDTGDRGPAGVSGQDGSSPTLVQFCQSCVTHYPDTFAEVGFCFNNVLYATYSANGGFSSEIPNGTYSSQGINCSCTFSVTGCNITN